jgi:nucleotide-binding universal stress UspA family protein
MNKSAGFSRILVAIDGSDVSMKAADTAITLAKKNTAKLLVVSAIDPAFGGPYMTDLGDYSKYAKKRAKEEAEKWFEEIRQNGRENKVEVETEIIDPKPSIAGSIVNYADHKKIDLIVVGSTGRTGFKRLLLGSVARDVVTYATCPVLVIK